MEEVLSGHQDVAECAVLGINDELKGEVPCGFIVLKAGVNPACRGKIESECVRLVRDKIWSGGVVPPGDHGHPAAEDALTGKSCPGTIKKMGPTGDRSGDAGDHRRPGGAR